MTTQIDNILPENFLLPGGAMQFDLTNAIRGLQGMPRALIICGFSNIDSPSLLAGAAAKVTSEQQAIAISGRSSVLHQMYMALSSIVRLSMDIYFYRLDESIGTAASQTIAFTIDGTLDADVPVIIQANGANIPVILTDGSDQNAVAAALGAAINANSSIAAMSATVADNAVTATCSFGGTESNDMLLCINGTQNSDVLISGSITDVTAGTGDQNTATLFAYLAVTRITQAAWPGRMNDTVYGVVSSTLEELWGPDQMRETQMLEVLSSPDVGGISSLLSTRNSHQVASLCVSLYLNAPVWSICAAAVGNIEYSASIDPGLPLRDMELVGIDAPSENFDKTERNSILQDGGSTVYVLSGSMYIERMVTNYTMNNSGVDDASYRNLEWIKTMSWWRWFVMLNFTTKFNNYKLAEVYDPAFDDQPVMTLELAQEVMLDLYGQAVDAALMQDRDGYQQDLQMEIDGASGRLKYSEKPRLITQLFQTEVTSEPILGSLS